MTASQKGQRPMDASAPCRSTSFCGGARLLVASPSVRQQIQIWKRINVMSLSVSSLTVDFSVRAKNPSWTRVGRGVNDGKKNEQAWRDGGVCTMKSRQRQRRLSLLGLCVIPVIQAESTGFPGTLPSPHSHRRPNDNSVIAAHAGASSDDEDHVLQDSSDFEEGLSDALTSDEGEDLVVEREVLKTESTEPHQVTIQVNDDEPTHEVGEPSVEYTEHDNEESSTETPGSSSQPLKTLQKLQHMLDSTDYMTATPSYVDAPRQVSVSTGSGWSPDHGDVEEAIKEPEPVSHGPPTTETATVVSPAPPMAETATAVSPANPPTTETSTQVSPAVPPATETTTQGSPAVPKTTESSTKTITSATKAQKPSPPKPPQRTEQLWTSKDRSKYKKQQQRLRIETEKRRRQLQSLPIHPNSSDDDMTDPETEGEGLGYALPNLPVYYTDDEGGITTDGLEIETPTRFTQQQQSPPQQQQQAFNYPGPPYPYPDQAGAASAQPPPYVGYPPGSYPMPYPYGSYTPQQQQQIYAAQQQQAAAWAASVGTTTPYGPPLYPPWSRSSYRVPSTVSRQPQQSNRSKDWKPATPMNAQAQVAPNVDKVVTLAEVGTMANFDSLQKLFILMVGVVLLCYCAVSPRTLELVDYNQKFKENIGIVALAFIAPIINFLFVFDARENDVNDVLSTLYTSATAGYLFAFVLELVLTTVLRLGVFVLWEPNVFDLTPKVPALVLPWVLRENRYRPKRITLFIADFVTSCVAAPIVEEYIKLKILQLSVRLPKNFTWTTKRSVKKGKKRKRRVAEAIQKGPGEREVININNYVTEMLAASLGIKLFDAVRRILMYTKNSDLNKGFYALCRGIFPIHELCGTMTALSLAKRDVLGVDIPLWRMLAPAVVIHGMANFRGMKPLFKWNSATPWSEMQLSPWNVADDSTFSQLLSKGFAKLMWLVILGRVLGYCIKNYYLITRQAVKRTTTYAGKHAAFSAELAAAEMLKKSKEK